MATMAPSSYTIELHTEMTGWASRKGVRYHLVVALLALARLCSRSRLIISQQESRDNFGASLRRVAQHGQPRAEARVRGGWVPVENACEREGCPGPRYCKGNTDDLCPIFPNSFVCAKCGSDGPDVEADITGRVLCRRCYDSGVTLHTLGLSKGTIPGAVGMCNRCQRPGMILEHFRPADHTSLTAGLYCGSCRMEMQRSERILKT